MAIGEKLEYLNDTKTAIKGALQNRGVTVSDTDTFRSYADKVGQIGETVEKTKFGASIDTFLGDVDENGTLNSPTWTGALNFAGVKAIGAKGLEYAFYHRSGLFTGITSVDLSSVQSVGTKGMSYSFYSTNITSVDLSSLQSVGSEGMYNTFAYCTSLTSVDLSSLQSVEGSGLPQAFQDCRYLITISFPALTDVQSNSFGNASYNFAFIGCSRLTEIHFRADMQATIEAMSGYSSKWGATNATIYFDL